MRISEDKVRQAWNRAEGKCENYDRHGAPKKLDWANRGRKDDSGWDVVIDDPDEPITAANLRVLCYPCQRRVRKPY